MFARIVLFVVLFFSCLSSLMGQTTDIVLQPSWNPSTVAQQQTCSAENYAKATYLVNGKDVTKKVLSLKIDRKLPVGTIIRFPSSLLCGQSLKPEGKTLIQLCKENPSWNCRQVQRDNRIHSIHRKLTREIRVPAIKEVTTAPKEIKLPPAPVKSPSSTHPVKPEYHTSSLPLTLAWVFIILTIALLIYYIIISRHELAAALRHRHKIPIPSFTAFKPKLTWPNWRREKISLQEQWNSQGFADSFITSFCKGHTPKPGENRTIDSVCRVSKTGVIKIYIFPAKGRSYPNMSEYRSEVLEVEEVVLEEEFAKGYRRLRPPRSSFSLRFRKRGVKFVYERGES